MPHTCLVYPLDPMGKELPLPHCADGETEAWSRQDICHGGGVRAGTGPQGTPAPTPVLGEWADRQMGEVQGAAGCRVLGKPGGLIEPQFPSSEMEASGPSAWTQWAPGQKQPPAAPRGHCALSMNSACPPSLPWTFWGPFHPGGYPAPQVQELGGEAVGLRRVLLRRLGSHLGFFCFFSAHLDFLSWEKYTYICFKVHFWFQK